MAQKAVEVGYGILNGRKPASDVILLEPSLVTRDNVDSYKGWSAAR
jgi:ribose transport system substrate-binding protein